MWTIILLVIAVCFAIKFFNAKIAIAALYWYLAQKNIPDPTGEELDQGIRYALASFPREVLGWRKDQ